MFRELAIGEDAFAITPGASFGPKYAVSLYVGGAGDVEVVTAKGTTVVFTAVPVGQYIPVVCKSVESTNTTATNIVGIR